MIDANNGQVTDKVSHATFAGTTARFDIQSYDACNDYTPLHNGFAYDVLLPTGSFVIDSRLNSATLDASVSLYDYVTQGELNLAVHLVWTPTSGISSSKGHGTTTLPDGTKYVYSSTGSSRTAASAGTVSDGTTNYTPDPTQLGYMSSVKSSDLTITR